MKKARQHGVIDIYQLAGKSAEKQLLDFFILSLLSAGTIAIISGLITLSTTAIVISTAAVLAYLSMPFVIRYTQFFWHTRTNQYPIKMPAFVLEATFDNNYLTQALSPKEYQQRLNQLYALRHQQTGVPIQDRENLSLKEAEHYYRIAERFLDHLEGQINKGLNLDEENRNTLNSIFSKTEKKSESRTLPHNAALFEDVDLPNDNHINKMYALQKAPAHNDDITTIVSPAKVAYNEMAVYNKLRSPNAIALLETESPSTPIEPTVLRKAHHLQKVLSGKETSNLARIFLHTDTPPLSQLKTLCAFLYHALGKEAFSHTNHSEKSTLLKAVNQINQKIPLAKALGMLNAWESIMAQKQPNLPVDAELLITDIPTSKDSTENTKSPENITNSFDQSL